MLVTCLKCKKPVFVSSAALGAGEELVPCAACHTPLIVSESGSVRFAAGTTNAAPPPPPPPPPPLDDDPTTEQRLGPALKPRAGLGSFGEDVSLTVGVGMWVPRPPGVLFADAQVPPPIRGQGLVPVSSSPIRGQNGVPASPPPIPDDARAPVPPASQTGASPERLAGRPAQRGRSPLAEPFGEKGRLPPPDPADREQDEVLEPTQSAALAGAQTPPEPEETSSRTGRPPAAPEPNEMSSRAGQPPAAPEPDETSSRAGQPPAAPEPDATSLRAGQPPAAPEPDATSLRAGKPPPAPESVGALSPSASAEPEPPSTLESRPPGEEQGSPSAVGDAGESPAVRAAVESWTVAQSPHRGQVDGTLPAAAVRGRAGTVPIDQEAFRRALSRSRLPRLVVLALTPLALAGLWAAGLVHIPGIPTPSGVDSLLDPENVPRFGGAEPESTPTSVVPPQAAPPTAASVVPPDETPPAGAADLDTVVPVEQETPAAEAPAQQAPERANEADAETAGRKRGKRRRKAGGQRRTGDVEVGARESVASSSASGPTGSAKTSGRSDVAPPEAELNGISAAVRHYKQGNLYLREKKVAPAIEELKRAVTINPGFGLAYRSLGVAYMLLGREKSAVKSYERFVAIEPSHRDAKRVREIIADYYRRNPKK